MLPGLCYAAVMLPNTQHGSRWTGTQWPHYVIGI